MGNDDIKTLGCTEWTSLDPTIFKTEPHKYDGVGIREL